MALSLRVGNVRAVFLLIAVQWFMFTYAELSVCSKSKEGNQTLYRKVSGNDGVLICIKSDGQYLWKSLDGSSTLGEKFNPARDCSDIVDNLPGAKNGFYWIKHYKGKLSKGWCDTHTDSGGFLLIGMKNNPVTWDVPSNDTPVDPMGPAHWSSEFGDVNVQDFAIQISTSKNFEDTKAHWSYRLETNRPLGNLFGVGSGGCTDFHSGIGNVSYVKDILTETVVSTNFNCSQFGPHTDLGWGRMNYCLRNKCPKGYAFIKGFPLKLDSHGSFSYSASSQFSGITHDATAFVGCDAGKCCACFGPKGGRGHYCSRKCQAVNGGTVLTGKVYVWYWIRTRMPKRVWKRCMEFKMKTAAGKFETYYIDRNTGTAHKGTCSEQFQTFLNEGTLLVKNKESFNNLPAVPGLLLYREDNEKLYVNNGNKWDAIGNEKETENLSSDVKQLKVNLQNKSSQQDVQFKNLETNTKAKLQSLASKNSQQDTRFKNLETNINAKFAQFKNLETNINAKLQSLASKNSQQDTQFRNINTKLQSLGDKLKKIETKLLNVKSKYGSKSNPGRSCKYILAADKFAVSGTYWIKLASVLKPCQVHCDMETRGGGWTLVYSYTFTNYNSFSSSSNAVTPRPNWPASSANVPISTTPPLSESSRGAVDWNLWKNIGKEFMVKSNINDWIVCQPANGGSLVTKKDGSMSCQNIKNVATACTGMAPKIIYWSSCGPFLRSSNTATYYYGFDGNTGGCWPVHNPCVIAKGGKYTHQKKGVSNPGGQIYIR